jgi:DNA mismatch repair ATPase MutS
MDEVGRGTTVRDGLAIAFATVHHLYSRNQCRALFATHFHELAHMLGWSNVSNDSERCPGISFFCTDVVESEVRVVSCD